MEADIESEKHLFGSLESVWLLDIRAFGSSFEVSWLHLRTSLSSPEVTPGHGSLPADSKHHLPLL